MTTAEKKVLEGRKAWISPFHKLTLKKSEGTSQVYYGENPYSGEPTAMGFRGRAVKPTFYHRFLNEDRRDAHTEDFFKSIEEYAARKAEVAAKRKATPHTLKVGDILHCSWGYDQTNNDYFQVTKLIGKTMVEIREIGKARRPDYRSADKVTALKDNFLSPRYEGDTQGLPMRKKVSGDSVRIYSFAHASKWDGQEDYETALGWGH